MKDICDSIDGGVIGAIGVIVASNDEKLVPMMGDEREAAQVTIPSLMLNLLQIYVMIPIITCILYIITIGLDKWQG